MSTPTTFTPVAQDPQQLGTSSSTLFTAGADGAVLDYILLVNDTPGSAVKVTLYHVPAGLSVGDDNIICKDAIIPGDGWGVNVLEQIDARPFHLEALGTIRGLAAAASQVTVQIGGTDYA
ncbi:MAG: hypothetical protein WEC75_03115 [Dehalococcoidia bacterium]